MPSTIVGVAQALPALANDSGNAEVINSGTLLSNNLEPLCVAGAGAMMQSMQKKHFTAKDAPVGALTPTALQ